MKILIPAASISNKLDGCFGFNGPLRQCLSISSRLSETGRKERVKCQNTPTRTYKHSRSCPTIIQISRTPYLAPWLDHDPSPLPSPPLALPLLHPSMEIRRLISMIVVLFSMTKQEENNNT